MARPWSSDGLPQGRSVGRSARSKPRSFGAVAGSGYGSADRPPDDPADAARKVNAGLSLGAPTSEMRGCDRSALITVPASSAATSYGHVRRKSGEPANATFTSTSCRAHSASSSAERPGQTGSPTPRTGSGAWASMNERHKGMRRAGLRPTTRMSTKCTRSARSPRRAHRRPVLCASVATSTGSPTARDRSITPSTASMDPLSPRYQSAS